MKTYISLYLAILSLLASGPINSRALAQPDSATHEDPADSSANLPSSSTHPIIEPIDSNKVIQQEKSGKVVPEKIAPPLEGCVDIDEKGVPKVKYNNKQNKCKKKP